MLVSFCENDIASKCIEKNDVVGEIYHFENVKLLNGSYILNNKKQIPYLSINEFFSNPVWVDRWRKVSKGVSIDGLDFKNFEVGEIKSTGCFEELPIDEAIFFQYAFDSNYHHFIFSSLPRLGIVFLEKYKDTPVIIKSTTPVYQKEIIKKIASNVIEIDVKKEYRFRKVFVIDFKNLSPSYIDFFYNSLDLNRSNIYNCQKDRICISREDDLLKRRPISNTLNFSKFLKEKSIDSIMLSKLSFSDKKKIFSNSKEIYGPFGAGWANIVFCTGKTELHFFEHPTFGFLKEYQLLADFKGIKVNKYKKFSIKWFVLKIFFRFSHLLGMPRNKIVDGFAWTVDVPKINKKVKG